jgi:hypothetical protein
VADKFPCKIAAASLTASDNTVVAALAGTGFKVWQVIVGNAGTAATFSFKNGGSQQSASIEAPASNNAILPFTGSPWAFYDTGNPLVITASAALTATVYYTQD